MGPLAMHADGRLTTIDKQVYCVVSLSCRGGPSARISMFTLCRFSGAKETAVRAAIKNLVACGWIKAKPSVGGHPTRYFPVQVNPSSREVGVSPDELLGSPDENFLDPDELLEAGEVSVDDTNPSPSDTVASSGDTEPSRVESEPSPQRNVSVSVRGDGAPLTLRPKDGDDRIELLERVRRLEKRISGDQLARTYGSPSLPYEQKLTFSFREIADALPDEQINALPNPDTFRKIYNDIRAHLTPDRLHCLSADGEGGQYKRHPGIRRNPIRAGGWGVFDPWEE